MTKISVIIPTFRRPEGLRRALRSVLSQHGAPDFEVVIVDNAPEGGAAESIADLMDARVRVIDAPRPGVATARNVGWAAAQAPRIAFLDDDETAPPHWLAALDKAATDLDADAVFGPIEGVAPEGGWPGHGGFLTDFFGRKGPAETQRIDDYHGCGNSLIDRARAGLHEPPFDPACDILGGEDDRLFSTMQARGARFGWAAEALAYEHPLKERATLRYALKRSFAFGQGPSQTAAQHKRVLSVARWMLIGAAQAGLYGAAAALIWLTGSDRRAFLLGRAAQGLGKLLWFGPFAPRLYGGAQISSAASETASNGAEAEAISAARPGANDRTDSA